MGEIMPMVDALVIWAEEGRVFKRDNNGESLNRRFQSLVSEWSNPPAFKGGDPTDLSVRRGTWRTETSQYPEEKKSHEIPLVAASESGTV